MVVDHGRSLNVARRTGRIAVEEIKLEGGIVVKVTLDKESGVFHARYDEVFKGDNIESHGGERWKDKDLDALRKQVKEWYKEKVQLRWEPVIVIYPNRDRSYSNEKKVLGGSFERLMRAKKLKGDEYEWRSWAYSKPDGGFVCDKDLEVYPSSGKDSTPTAFGSDEDPPIIMPYTPERWLSLLQLVKHKIGTLNVAGNRESKSPGIMNRAIRVLLFTILKEADDANHKKDQG